MSCKFINLCPVFSYAREIEDSVIALNINKPEITECFISTLLLFPMSVCKRIPIVRWKLIKATSLGFYMRRWA